MLKNKLARTKYKKKHKINCNLLFYRNRGECNRSTCFIVPYQNLGPPIGKDANSTHFKNSKWPYLEINNHFWGQFPLIVIYYHQKSRAELSKSSRSMIYCCRQKDGDCEWAERTISHSHGEIHSHMYNETVCISHGESQTQSHSETDFCISHCESQTQSVFWR